VSTTRTAFNAGHTQDVHQGPLYNRSRQLHKYTSETGVYMVPIAGTASAGGESVRLVTLHRPYGMRTVLWDAAKQGSPPMMPKPEEETLSGDRLVSTGISLYQPTPMLGGQGFSWEVAGEYTYVQTNVRGKDSNYETGLWPFRVELNMPPNPNLSGYFLGTDSASLTDDPDGFSLQEMYTNPYFRYTSTTIVPTLFSEMIR
jgi:hypothetical protein